MSEQTVVEVLTAATDSVTLINDVNTNGANSTRIMPDLTQAEINAVVQKNVDHLELILEYTEPDVKNSSDDKSSYTSAITTGKAYIAAN